MAPFTTSLSSLNNTSASIPPTQPFYDLGSVFGIEIVYLIIGGIALVCIVVIICGILLICCKCGKCCKSSKKHKINHQHDKSAPVEIANGMQLNWKYTIKAKPVESTYKSADLELTDQNHQNGNNNINNEEQKAFDRIVHDKQTIVTHNPLQQQQSVPPLPAENPPPPIFNNIHAEHALSYGNYPQSMPNNINATQNNMGMHPTYNNNYNNNYANYNHYKYPQSVPNHTLKMQQIVSDTDPYTFNAELGQSEASSEESSSEYKTEFDTTTHVTTQATTTNNNIQSVRNINVNVQNVQVVDTLTNIVNNANYKNGSVVLNFNNKVEMNEMEARVSYGASSVGFNREPSLLSLGVTSIADSQFPPYRPK